MNPEEELRGQARKRRALPSKDGAEIVPRTAQDIYAPEPVSNDEAMPMPYGLPGHEPPPEESPPISAFS